MSDTLRKPRPAAKSRPLPTLEHVAAALALGSLAAAPFVAQWLPDAPCDNGAQPGALARAVRALEQRGAFTHVTGREVTPGDACPALQPQPDRLMAPGGMASVTLPTGVAPTPADNMPAGGAPPTVTPQVDPSDILLDGMMPVVGPTPRRHRPRNAHPRVDPWSQK